MMREIFNNLYHKKYGVTVNRDGKIIEIKLCHGTVIFWTNVTFANAVSVCYSAI